MCNQWTKEKKKTEADISLHASTFETCAAKHTQVTWLMSMEARQKHNFSSAQKSAEAD